MFSLSVVDHLRLDFRLVVQNYTAHARAAERLSVTAFKIKIAIVAFLALATGSIMLSLVRPGREYQVAAAVVAALALAIQVGAIAFGAEARVHFHRLFAQRLWLMCERYRSLLTEIQDSLVDNAAILHRRDVLTRQVHAIYEQGFPVDQRAYEGMRQLSLEDTGDPITDAQIDRLIPVARRAG